MVLYSNGECKEYYQNRINDIKEILKENREALQGAIIADKVIGKVAGSILTVAGVKEIYADVMSKYAITVLDKNNIRYEYIKRGDIYEEKSLFYCIIKYTNHYFNLYYNYGKFNSSK